MRTQLQVLSAGERDQIHERSLKVLATTGVKVASERGLQLLKEAGADVGKTTEIVRFPRTMVEEALRLPPRKFKLGGRRPGWDLDLNAGDCSLLADGGAVNVLDFETGELRPGCFDDWLTATHLVDAMDEIGVYWSMVEGGFAGDLLGDFVSYWRNIFKNCSKHIQEFSRRSQESPPAARHSGYCVSRQRGAAPGSSYFVPGVPYLPAGD